MTFPRSPVWAMEDGGRLNRWASSWGLSLLISLTGALQSRDARATKTLSSEDPLCWSEMIL